MEKHKTKQLQNGCDNFLFSPIPHYKLNPLSSKQQEKMIKKAPWKVMQSQVH